MCDRDRTAAATTTTCSSILPRFRASSVSLAVIIRLILDKRTTSISLLLLPLVVVRVLLLLRRCRFPRRRGRNDDDVVEVEAEDAKITTKVPCRVCSRKTCWTTGRAADEEIEKSCSGRTRTGCWSTIFVIPNCFSNPRRQYSLLVCGIDPCCKPRTNHWIFAFIAVYSCD